MKTVARKGFLLLLLLQATSHSLQIPDFIEEELSVPSDIKYSTDKTEDADDEMSDETSASADEDAEMMENVDSSQVRNACFFSAFSSLVDGEQKISSSFPTTICYYSIGLK